MKRFISLLMAAIMILSLAACGAKDTGEVKEPESTETAQEVQPEADSQQEEAQEPAEESKRISDADIEISFWHHMEGTNANALETVCNNFNDTVGKEYGIIVTPSFQGTNTAEKLNTLAQAGDWVNFPDICQVASAGIPTISGYDLFVSPEEMYAKGENIILPRESIIANNARTFTYKDELCAIPFSNSTILLYYNKGLFEDGDEVTTYGLNVQVKRYQLVNWVGGEGEYNFIGDNEGGRAGLMSKVTFGEDGTLMTYLDEWEKVIATGGYKPVEDNINEEFAMELSAMAIMSSARIGKLKDLIGDEFEWGTAPLPKVNASDKGGTAVGGSGIVMFDKGDADELTATWIFQQYLGGEDAQYDFCTASGYIPMNKDLYETEKMKTYMAENPEIVAAVDQLLASNPNVQEPFDIVTGDINSIIDEEMVAFAQGEQDKQTTHDNIVNKCNQKLADYVKVNAE